MRFVIGRKWSDLEFKKMDFYWVLYIKRAEAFETVDVILTAEQAEHINERHVDPFQHTQTSKFFKSFNLSATLGLLSRRTWEDRHDVELMERGWKQGHCDYYIYVFDLYKCVGLDSWGYPCRHIAVYFSHKPSFSDKFQIITAYPFTHSYNNYFMSRRRSFSYY